MSSKGHAGCLISSSVKRGRTLPHLPFCLFGIAAETELLCTYRWNLSWSLSLLKQYKQRISTHKRFEQVFQGAIPNPKYCESRELCSPGTCAVIQREPDQKDLPIQIKVQVFNSESDQLAKLTFKGSGGISLFLDVFKSACRCISGCYILIKHNFLSSKQRQAGEILCSICLKKSN